MSDLSTLPTPALRYAAVLDLAPTDFRGMLAAAGLARFEEAGDYAGLLTALVGTICPRDVIEWIWTKDLADLSWEARRARLAKAAVLAVSRPHAANDLIRMGLADADAAEIDGQAYRRKLDELERLDRLSTIAGVRRDAVLRELQQRRERIMAMRQRAMRPDSASFDASLRAGSG